MLSQRTMLISSGLVALMPCCLRQIFDADHCLLPRSDRKVSFPQVAQLSETRHDVNLTVPLAESLRCACVPAVERAGPDTPPYQSQSRETLDCGEILI